MFLSFLTDLTVFTETLCHEQDVVQGQFLNGVQLVWIQNFPSPILIAILMLKSPVYYSPLLDSYFSQWYLCYVKCKQPYQGFELVSSVSISYNEIET